MFLFWVLVKLAWPLTLVMRVCLSILVVDSTKLAPQPRLKYTSTTFIPTPQGLAHFSGIVNCRSQFVGERLIDRLLTILASNNENMEVVISLEKDVDGVNPAGSTHQSFL